MKNFSYDMLHQIEIPTIVLSTVWHKHLGTITNISMDQGISTVFNMNAVDEVSFDVYKELDGNVCDLWDSIVDFKYIYIPDYEAYYMIVVSIDENDATIKHVTAQAAGEVELGNRNLIDFHCNDEVDILMDDYDADMPTVIYREVLPTDPEDVAKKKRRSSLLHRVLADKCPDWNIGYVADTVRNIQRTFTCDSESIYDFLTGTVGEEIDALFVFDSVNRLINVYDLLTTCNACGYRGSYVDECPKCGSKQITYGYGKRTGIFLNVENYATEINVSGETDNVKNCLRLVAGDEIMTAAVRNINPNGSQYIYHFSEDMLRDMPEGLVEAIVDYNETYEEYLPEYNRLTSDWYEQTDRVLYLEHEMMPETPIPGDTTAQEQLTLLEGYFKGSNPKTVAVQTVTTYSPSVDTANVAVEGYARTLIDPRYNVEVFDCTLSPTAETNIKKWTGKFIVTSLGATDDDEEKDKAKSVNPTSIEINDRYETFLYEKIVKSLDRTDAGLQTIFNMESDTDFQNELTKYCLNRLLSFKSTYDSVLETLSKMGINATNPEYRDYFGVDLYQTMYLPYYNRSVMIQKEADTRSKEVEMAKLIQADLDQQRQAIQEILDFPTFIGQEYYTIFSMYRKEGEYNNSNYISTNLNNVELIDKAKEFFEAARDESEKASETEITISETLNNLFNTKEFADYKDSFDIGDWLVTEVNGELFKLRLVTVEYETASPESITFTFSNVDRMKSLSDDINSILSQAQSVSNTYNFVAHQAKQGNQAKETINDMKENGVDSSVYSILSGAYQGIVIDDHGILLKDYDEINQRFYPDQMRLNNNTIEYTDDDWRTVKAAIGKIDYTLNGVKQTKYGINAETVISGLIISGDIYSNNYRYDDSEGRYVGSHIDLNTGSFVLGSGAIRYSADANELLLGNNVVIRSESGAPVSVRTEIIGKQDKLEAGNYIEINGNVISTVIPNYVGATASTAGTRGLVPPASAGDQEKFLKADGTWAVAGTPTYEVTRAQYDAIPPVIRENGDIYFITDGEPGGGGGSKEVYYGTTTPSNSFGKNGNIYMQYNSNGIIAVFGKINGVWMQFPSGGFDGNVRVQSSFTPLTNIPNGDTVTTSTSITGEVTG